MSELAYLSASEALRLFRARELSPREVMGAVIERAQAVEPKINAFVDQRFEEAMAQARQAEARYMGKGAAPRPLEGIAVAIKEEHPIAGMSYRGGSLVTEGQVAEITHPIVERIMAAGGIIHARTTTPEFSCAGFTHSKLWGVTRNPWHLDYSPGGSSGGSGAALAAGSTMLATGSDIGGSIRIPASFCGLVGFKAPYGRVPALPPFNLDHYCHDGPMARTVADCALLQNLIAGPHPLDGVSLRPTVQIPSTLASIKGWQIALCIHLGDYPVDPEVVTNTYAVAEALREAGAIVTEVELNWTRAEIMRAAGAHFGAIFAPSIRDDVPAKDFDLLMPYTRYFVEFSEKHARDLTYLEGLAIEGTIYAELGQLLANYAALVCPTTAIPALHAADDYTATKVIVDGTELDSYLELLMTLPFNITSRCPVLSVPSGRASNGIPTGVQLVGPTYDDISVFRVAQALEQVRPWFGEKSWRPYF